MSAEKTAKAGVRPRVFMIYARADLRVAKEIADQLRTNGMEPWLDVEQIQAGQLWKDVVANALDESAIAIILLSKNFVARKWAMEELNHAMANLHSPDKYTTPIIPVKIDSTEVPATLAHIQYVDMEAGDEAEFLLKSVDAVMQRVLGARSQARQPA